MRGFTKEVRPFAGRFVPGRDDVPPLDVLRTYLASCCVQHEHAPLLPPDLSEPEN